MRGRRRHCGSSRLCSPCLIFITCEILSKQIFQTSSPQMHIFQNCDFSILLFSWFVFDVARLRYILWWMFYVLFIIRFCYKFPKRVEEDSWRAPLRIMTRKMVPILLFTRSITKGTRRQWFIKSNASETLFAEDKTKVSTKEFSPLHLLCYFLRKRVQGKFYKFSLAMKGTFASYVATDMSEFKIRKVLETKKLMMTKPPYK